MNEFEHNSNSRFLALIVDHPGRRRGGFDRREVGGPPPPPPPPFHRGGPDNGYPMPGARGDRRVGDPGRRGGPEGLPGVSLLVRNIAPDITSADLKSAFGRIGVIRDVYVPLDYHSQQPRGFAFIEYATPEMAREAKLEMNRFVIKGHELEVVFAQERRKTPGEMRGRSIDAPDGAPASNRGGDRGRGGFERYVHCCLSFQVSLHIPYRLSAFGISSDRLRLSGTGNANVMIITGTIAKPSDWVRTMKMKPLPSSVDLDREVR